MAVYTIGEMAKRLGVSPSTLRYYDKEGLLPDVERSEGGIRRFTDADYSLLQIIGCLKATGMSIRDIRCFIQMILQGNETIDDRLQLFYRRREEVERQIAALQETLAIIQYKCWYYETAKAAGTTAAPEAVPLDALPAPLRAVRLQLHPEEA